MNTLSQLKGVDLRAAWPHEARDFTKWLAEPDNLANLGDILGLELTPVQVESPIGRYQVDILATDAADNFVVIENQLESTDHKHLGQLITYAAFKEATTVIWIVSDSGDEHRLAIQWLNDRTDERTEFYLVRIELWRIDDSRPAHRFVVVEAPNLRRKVEVGRESRAAVSDIGLQQLDFWTQYKSFVADHDTSVQLQTPRAQHWFNYSIGTAQAHISLTVNSRANQIGVEIYIPSNKELYYALEQDRSTLESAVGEVLSWDPIEDKKAARIQLSRHVPGLFDAANYNDYFEWLYTQQRSFEQVFAPAIKEALGMTQVAGISVS